MILKGDFIKSNFPCNMCIQLKAVQPLQILHCVYPTISCISLRYGEGSDDILHVLELP